MNTAPSQFRPPKIDTAIGLAAGAWEAMCLANGRAVTTSSAVVPLKSRRVGRKSGVYRLEGAGEDGSAIIAKCSKRCTSAIERIIYEQLLPRVDVSRLRYYGYFQDPADDFDWLFLEDAGQTKPTAADSAIVADWLARLHAGAASLSGEITLPERGPAHYLDHLRTCRELARTSLVELPLGEQERQQLHALQRVADQLESRWDSICAACAAAPRTLVHGDLSSKNLRLRRCDAGVQMVAMDWETAGWGPPAADIPYWPTRLQRPPKPGKPPRWNGTVPLNIYAASAARLWEGAGPGDLERVARIGNVFRAVAGARWTAEQLRAGGGMKRLGFYVEFLPRVLILVDD
jgi:hypothetical protein